MLTTSQTKFTKDDLSEESTIKINLFGKRIKPIKGYQISSGNSDFPSPIVQQSPSNIKKRMKAQIMSADIDL